MQGGGSACVTRLNQRCLETSQPSARVIQISYDTWGLLTQPISEFWEGLGFAPPGRATWCTTLPIAY